VPSVGAVKATNNMSVPAISSTNRRQIVEEEKNTLKPKGVKVAGPDEFEDDLDNLLQPTGHNSKVGI
jgi:hypothetical protein